jgi:hypothetical protein
LVVACTSTGGREASADEANRKQVEQVEAEASGSNEAAVEQTDGDELDAMLIEQSESILRYALTEIKFIDQICLLDESQKKKLKTIDRKWITNKLKANIPVGQQGVVAQFAIAFGFARQPNRPQETTDNDLRAQVQMFLSSVLSDEQKRIYENETKARDEFRRAASADYVIVLLDRKLILSKDQIEKLKPALAVNLSQNLAWQVYSSNPEYFPSLPMHTMRDVLTEKQFNLLSQWTFNDFSMDQFQMQLDIDAEGEIVIEEQ